MKLFESRKEKFFKTVLLLFPLFLLQKQHLQEKLSSYMPSAILQFVLVHCCRRLKMVQSVLMH